MGGCLCGTPAGGRAWCPPPTSSSMRSSSRCVLQQHPASCMPGSPRLAPRGFIPQLFVQSLAVNMIAGPQQS